MLKIINVVGARPNFMKIAPLMDEMKKHARIRPILLHTGQHYDDKMSDVFFEELRISKPDIYLGVGSGSHAEQTAKVMMEFERVALQERPDLIVVVGDVNSTLACSLVAAKLLIPVAHVEAGLRSFDRTMPEEINRLVTDSLSDYLFTTCEEANKNLQQEGISEEKIFFVGNVMIDTLMKNIERIKSRDTLEKLGLAGRAGLADRAGPAARDFAVLTLHRPGNVDVKETFRDILGALDELQTKIKIVFPIHPRTTKQLKEFKLWEMAKGMKNLMLIDPLGYIDFLSLVSQAKLVMTDSGGLQEETTVLGIPCLTLRENTERPITVSEGTNVVVGMNKDRIIQEGLKILNGAGKMGQRPKLWDGKAATRIMNILIEQLGLVHRLGYSVVS
ncbi:MAG: UDP-N-acetylglucosamine 2-epimerase (non-hydrolyzing) [bacterium]|nr:UDP-N-acetylglucosamine 2-epimerase (non-hydrolyzing) [bacterium]